MIEVKVRSEVIDIDWYDPDPTEAVSTAEADPERLEFVLHGEEPETRLVAGPANGSG